MLLELTNVIWGIILDRRLRNRFVMMLESSLNSAQIRYLGENYDRTFNIYEESGYGKTIPIPTRTAAETLVDFFNTEEDVVKLFTILLINEGKRFHNREYVLYRRDSFLEFLEQNKWVYDKEMMYFFRDPFYEHEINFLKKIRIIDLREEVEINKLIKQTVEVINTLGDKDLEWRTTLRLFDLDKDNSELLRKIIELLLVRQDLKPLAFEMYTCLKELALNASKANYKLLFEKYVTEPQGISSKKNYPHFLQMFKDEIMEHGNSRLFELAKKKNRYINITFQSTNDSIEVWVVNNQNISTIEKKAIMQRLGYSRKNDAVSFMEDDQTEGAGLGLMLIINILKKYSDNKIPLKVVFYPDYVKIGFSLNRKYVQKVLNQQDSET